MNMVKGGMITKSCELKVCVEFLEKHLKECGYLKDDGYLQHLLDDLNGISSGIEQDISRGIENIGI